RMAIPILESQFWLEFGRKRIADLSRSNVLILLRLVFDTAALRSGRSATVLKARRRNQRKKVSFLWPRNGREGEPLAHAGKCHPLSRRTGEGNPSFRRSRFPRSLVPWQQC